MKNYVDGFIIPVAKSKIDDYLLLAQTAARIWKEPLDSLERHTPQ